MSAPIGPRAALQLTGLEEGLGVKDGWAVGDGVGAAVGGETSGDGVDDVVATGRPGDPQAAAAITKQSASVTARASWFRIVTSMA